MHTTVLGGEVMRLKLEVVEALPEEDGGRERKAANEVGTEDYTLTGHRQRRGLRPGDAHSHVLGARNPPRHAKEVDMVLVNGGAHPPALRHDIRR